MKRVGNALFLMAGIALGALARPWTRWFAGKPQKKYEGYDF
jgi:hypothetical protein